MYRIEMTYTRLEKARNALGLLAALAAVALLAALPSSN